MDYIFEHIKTEQIDPQISGDDVSTEVTFRCDRFLYYARCHMGIIQYVKGEHPDSYSTWSIPPTEQEIEGHDNRRRTFNQTHSIVQMWLDTL